MVSVCVPLDNSPVASGDFHDGAVLPHKPSGGIPDDPLHFMGHLCGVSEFRYLSAKLKNAPLGHFLLDTNLEQVTPTCNWLTGNNTLNIFEPFFNLRFFNNMTGN